MNDDHFRIILIGNADEYADVMRPILDAAADRSFDLIHEPTLGDGIRQLTQEPADIALIDLCAISDCKGNDAIARLRNEVPQTPLVVLTEDDEHDLGLELIKSGAQDSIPRLLLNPKMLWRTISHAVERSKAEKQLRTLLEELDCHQMLCAKSVHSLETANQHLVRLHAEAQQASVAKSEFLAHMSHEIRTPLTAILGYTDVLLDQLNDPDNLDAAQTIRRNGEHLLNILSDILDLSRIESGRLQLEDVECSPIDLVADVIELMRVRADAKGLDLEYEYLGPIPAKFRTDPTRVKQLLLNLVSNAIKFTEIGGVRLTVQFDILDSDGPRLRFEVIDTGIGIAPDRLQQIFDPFVQADSSMSRGFGGSGLGLTICGRLVRMLGGRVHVESTEGEGSVFTLTLPVTQNATDTVSSAVLPDKKASNKPSTDKSKTSATKRPNLACRVLYAEDGPDNQRIVSLLLRKAGAEVVIAENGKQAVEKAMASYPGWGKRQEDIREPFDLILMDMQMPIMDGYEATQLLRKEGFDKPIIALTAHAMSFDRQKCLDAGCDDYIAKPINRDEFLKTVAQYTMPRKSLPPLEGSDAEPAELNEQPL